MKRALLLGYLMTPVVFGIPYLLVTGQWGVAIVMVLAAIMYVAAVGMIVDMVVEDD